MSGWVDFEGSCYFCYLYIWLYGSLIFFFQAEDGIRDLVRSRGLGDVYKRQPLCAVIVIKSAFIRLVPYMKLLILRGCLKTTSRPVSYTHLTLPTSDLV
mgnify:CR=1 FL=1